MELNSIRIYVLTLQSSIVGVFTAFFSDHILTCRSKIEVFARVFKSFPLFKIKKQRLELLWSDGKCASCCLEDSRSSMGCLYHLFWDYEFCTWKLNLFRHAPFVQSHFTGKYPSDQVQGTPPQSLKIWKFWLATGANVLRLTFLLHQNIKVRVFLLFLIFNFFFSLIMLYCPTTLFPKPNDKMLGVARG